MLQILNLHTTKQREDSALVISTALQHCSPLADYVPRSEARLIAVWLTAVFEADTIAELKKAL